MIPIIARVPGSALRLERCWLETLNDPDMTSVVQSDQSHRQMPSSGVEAADDDAKEPPGDVSLLPRVGWLQWKAHPYGYDGNGRLSTITDPFTGQATTYGYTLPSPPAGPGGSGTLVTSRSDPNGAVTNYTYDTDGRLTQQTTTKSTTLMQFSLGYDNESRILSLNETYPQVSGQSNTGPGNWAYTYFGNGELKSAKLGAATAINYQYAAPATAPT